MPHCLGVKIDVTDSRMLRVSVHRKKKQKKKTVWHSMVGQDRLGG